MDQIHVKNIWNQWSDTWYRKYRTDEKIAKLAANPESAFHPTTLSMIKRVLPDLRGKKVCVPSSGDNHAVFAFHLMGATVTSCDISERQLENSSNIAREHGWDIEFICDDTMKLGHLASGEYDFVYTSNGVHVWITDLDSMYSNIYRILKSDGTYIMYDIHPFTRPFGEDTDKLTVVKPYDSVGPIVIDKVPRYTWRLQDIVNAVVSSGLSIKQMHEMFAEDGTFWVDEEKGTLPSQEELDNFCNWKKNPMAALPQWLSICAMK